VRHCNYVFRSDYRGVLGNWDWWSDEKMGGGTLGAIGSHAIDSFRWLLATEVSEVCCALATHVAERPDKSSGTMRKVTSDDTVRMLLRFAESPLVKGATGAVSLSVVESGKLQNQLEVYGSSGALMVEENGALWHSPAGSGDWRPVQVEHDPVAPGMRDSSWARGFTIYSKAIITALREGRTTVDDAADFEAGHRAQLVMDAARASNESNCWVGIE
jgi:predicted dehydrogenase